MHSQLSITNEGASSTCRGSRHKGQLLWPFPIPRIVHKSSHGHHRPHLVLATACTLLSWGAALLAVVQVLDNSRSGLLEGQTTFSPLLQLAWAVQAAGSSAFSFSRIAGLHSHESPLGAAKVCDNLFMFPCMQLSENFPFGPQYMSQLSCQVTLPREV